MGTATIIADDECDSQQPGSNAMSYPQAIPMYNVPYMPPLPSAPRSYPQTMTGWQQQQQPKSFYGSSSPPRSGYQLSTTNNTIWGEENRSDLPSLAPSFIPDQRYQSFLRTGKISSKRGSRGGPTFTNVCCAKFCAGFSFVAVGFLLFVGIIFDTQPLYIPGSLPKHLNYVDGSRSKTKIVYDVKPTDRLLQASNAYGAAFFYLLTGCICTVYAYDLISCYRRKAYEEIPDTDSIIPTFHTSRSSDYLLPTTMASAANMSTITSRRGPFHSRAEIREGVMETVRSYYNRGRLFLGSTWHADDYRRNRKRRADPKEV